MQHPNNAYNYSTTDTDSESNLKDVLTNLPDNILHIIIRNIRAAGKTQPFGKQTFAHPVDIGRIVGINRLFVHRFPQGTGLDTGSIQCYTHSLNVTIRLTIRMQGRGRMRNPSSAADSTLNSDIISMFFTLNVH